MRYVTNTDVSPEEVLDRAKRFFEEHSRLRVHEETPSSVTFTGEIGTANEARLLEELARRLDGVMRVESRLTWRLDDKTD